MEKRYLILTMVITGLVAIALSGIKAYEKPPVKVHQHGGNLLCKR